MAVTAFSLRLRPPPALFANRGNRRGRGLAALVVGPEVARGAERLAFLVMHRNVSRTSHPS